MTCGIYHYHDSFTRMHWRVSQHMTGYEAIPTSYKLYLNEQKVLSNPHRKWIILKPQQINTNKYAITIVHELTCYQTNPMWEWLQCLVWVMLFTTILYVLLCALIYSCTTTNYIAHQWVWWCITFAKWRYTYAIPCTSTCTFKYHTDDGTTCTYVYFLRLKYRRDEIYMKVYDSLYIHLSLVRHQWTACGWNFISLERFLICSMWVH